MDIDFNEFRDTFFKALAVRYIWDNKEIEKTFDNIAFGLLADKISMNSINIKLGSGTVIMDE